MTARFSMRTLAFAVLLIAVDCAACRFAFAGAIGLAFGLFGTLPFANLLAIAATRASGRARRPGRGTIGFLLIGAAAILAWFNLCLIVEERWLVDLVRGAMRRLADSRIGAFLDDALGGPGAGEPARVLGLLAAYVAASFAVELVVGLIGGLMAGWTVPPDGRGDGDDRVRPIAVDGSTSQLDPPCPDAPSARRPPASRQSSRPSPLL